MDVATTIAVDDVTRQRLRRLKERWELASYDAVLRRLLEDAEELPESMFGTAPGLTTLTPEERREMWDEEEHYEQGA